MAETPRPTRMREKMAKPRVWERPKRTDPMPAIRAHIIAVFLAPQASERMPAGICIAA
ncbi:MAG: hypothetical protein BWX92_03855 [Deltaproteobacteria bacterium ADurb.Bin135]|nr:MAG: hypothetical protein BWX92_03855 [Deltaproteobacteria bacterium ADurb.Bin135]